MRALLPLLLLLTLLPLASAQEPDAMLHAVDQEGQYVFMPDRLEVRPGGIVLVMAFGQEPHKVRANDGSFETGAIEPNGQTTFTAPTAPGEHPFYCPFHGEGMSGTLVVTEGAQPAAPTHADPTPTSPTPASEGANEAPGLAAGLTLAVAGAAALLRRR